MTSSRPWILTLSGYGKTGKDAIAEVLAGEPWNAQRVAFADPVRQLTGRLYGLPTDVEWWQQAKTWAYDGRAILDYTEPVRLMDVEGVAAPVAIVRRLHERQVVDPSRSPTNTLRDLLIHVGQELRALDPDFWLRQGLSLAKALQSEGRNVVVTDARFANEVYTFRRGSTRPPNVFSVRLRRPRTTPQGEADHAVDAIPVEWFDAEWNNDGTEIGELAGWVRTRMDDLLAEREAKADAGERMFLGDGGEYPS